MKKTIRILLPILLAVAIIFCTVWYLFVYDRQFTRDMLLTFARHSESQGHHSSATFFYNLAYSQADEDDAVAIELSDQYKNSGNYTKAEYTLSNAIADGGGIDLYIALCKTYIEQDKLLDAVNMLDSVTNEAVKAQLKEMRPAAPTSSPDPGFYNQYISVTLECAEGVIYASPNGIYPSVADAPYTQPIALVDGENTIYALTIAENGLVSPLAIFGYTVGGVVERMDFKDKAVEAEVRKLLGVSDTKELFTNDLWEIKSFTMPADATNYADLKHMAFLESLTIQNGVSAELKNISYLSNLTELSVSNVSVSQEDLKSISTLPLLTKLTLSGCSLSSVAPLEAAKNLVFLDLSNNTIRSIDPISFMQSLQELYLQHNAITDVAALSTVVTLNKLDLSYNAITNLAPVSTLTGLTWLNAETNSINNLGEMGKLTSLTYLSLKSNKLKNVSVIAQCTALTELNISSNELTDISNLSSLTKMTMFNFSYNKVTTLPKFSKKCALVTIDGGNNQISSLENLSGLQNLNYVYMDYNKNISSIKPLVSCPVLIEVNVYATKVKDVRPLTNQSVIVNYNPVK